MNMANVKQDIPPNPHQEAINNLVNRVLPRIREQPFARNQKEPWLGNTAVDKAVIATIETIFAIADEDRAVQVAVEETPETFEAQTELFDTQTEVIEAEGESAPLTMSEPSILPAADATPDMDQS